MSISHSSEIPTLAGGMINMEMIQRTSNSTIHRRTKIICTIGPSCWDVSNLEILLLNGMNVARLNFSHGDHDGHYKVLQNIRQAANNTNRNVAILLDTKGPEIRTGFFKEECSGKISLVKGETIVLTNDYSYKGDATKLACSYENIASSVTVGQMILIADGSLVLTVTETNISIGEVTCTINNNATIGERKNMNLPGVIVDLPTFTEKDVNDIVNFGIKYKVDFIAASFVRKASDVTNLRTLLKDNGGEYIKIICKIENQEGLQNYNAILQETDAIMVARGDLGMEIPPQKVFLAQKMMIREANLAGKPVITATQMLESMITNPRPTRAECSDVANAVLDGTDCVMLSGETANGPYFEEAVRVMSKTCCEAENARNYNAMYAAILRSTMKKYNATTTTGSNALSSPLESLASSAVKTAIDVQASIMVVLSETGNTARMIAKYCPGCAVICLTTSDVVTRQVGGIYKGVHAYYVDTLENNIELVQQTSYEAVLAGIAKPNDLMVVVSGTLSGTGQNNQVRVEVVHGKPTSAASSSSSSTKTSPMKRLASFVVATTD